MGVSRPVDEGEALEGLSSVPHRSLLTPHRPGFPSPPRLDRFSPLISFEYLLRRRPPSGPPRTVVEGLRPFQMGSHAFLGIFVRPPPGSSKPVSLVPRVC